MEKSISFSKLDFLFPGFVWWTACHELCGINFDTKQQICIDDGMCGSEDGTWVVFGYNLETIPKHWKRLKFESSEDMFIEERVKLIWDE